MKRLSFVLALLLATAAVALAQAGRPLYDITAVRAGDTIGVIMVEMYPDIAPLHVRNFDSLVSIGFYDSTAFHRVVPGFVIQGGDPNSRSGPEDTWGYGDPLQATVPAEFSVLSHTRGAFSAARADDINSATSQFFIVVRNATNLDRRYSIYGRVISGMDIADSIVNSPTVLGTQRPVQKIEMFVRRVGTDTTTPGRVVLASPGNDTTRIGPSVTLSWQPVVGAVLYELQVARDPEFTNVVLRDSIIGISRSATGLEQGTTDYYWRVRASNGGVRGPWSETYHFSTSMAAPGLLSPATADTVNLPVTFRWSPVEGASSYGLQIGRSLSMSTLVLDSSGIVGTEATVVSLEPGRYYWRVLADNGEYVVPSSMRWSFTVEGPASAEDEAAAADLDMIARAEAGRVVIEVSGARSGTASVSVVDVLGRELLAANVVGRRVIDLGPAPHGATFVVLRCGATVIVRRVVVAG